MTEHNYQTWQNRQRLSWAAILLKVVADRGYYKGEEILACEQSGITTFLPKPQTSGNQAKGLFGRRDFIYNSELDLYDCHRW